MNFRQYLQSELARRCAKNAKYSLRAFAMTLRIDHSTLSQILRGKRAVTRRTVQSLAPRLKLDESAVAGYLEDLRRPPAVTIGAVRAVEELAQDMARAISEWHHHAILELIRLEDFRPDSRWIARVLDLSVDEVNMALQRLLRLGMLEMTSSTHWIDRSGESTGGSRAFALEALSRMCERIHRLTQVIHNTKEKSNGKARHAMADSRKGPRKAQRVLHKDV
jgi:transcriptional regulator with XRE-family HTH domain